jgi:epoxide hydrolase
MEGNSPSYEEVCVPVADTEVRPFTIAIPDAQLDDLHNRLARVRWPTELPGVGWSRGVPLAYLQRLAEYWRTTYDWRQAEARVNQFPHFTTTIAGQMIHFLHIRSPEANALPLILTHGWPGSVVEFLGILEPLTDPAAHGAEASDAFHVVAPSLPGFGFSTPLQEPGWDTRRVARAWAELMRRLGYSRYGAQGGDTGAIVSPELGRIDGQHVVGVHANGLTVFPTGDPAGLAELTDREQARLARLQQRGQDGLGYAILQSTRPQTLAYALADSPVGQLAWIVEKFKEWTDPAAELPEDAVDRDQLLTNVTLYWLTNTAGSSAQIYYEGRGAWGQPVSKSTVPTGVAVFPDDFSVRSLVEREHTIVHWTEFDRGGHFAAMETPDLLVDDVRRFFRPLRSRGG